MKVVLVQRPLSGVAPEEVLQGADTTVICEPVAIICLAHDISDEEMTAMGLDILESIGDKPVDTNQVMAVYTMLMGLS